jgi:AraC family ethanolamine operon transcriptional activator
MAMPAPILPRQPAELRTYQTHDIDEQAALLRGWNQTYNQISGGTFSGELSEAEVGGLYLFREKTSKSLYQVGALPAGRVAVGLPLSLPGAAKFCGQACDGTQAHIFSGANGFEFQTPNGLDMAGLVIPETILRAVMLDDELEAISRNAQTARLKGMNSTARNRLRRLLIGAIETLQAENGYAAAPRLSKVFAADAARATIECLGYDGSDQPLTLTETRCRTIVREAQRLALDSPKENLTIEDICRTLEISRRTLQTCFQRALGIRPASYLRAVRLNAARRTLKECGSVTEAATAWGFWHFGRFAQDYRLMFGEHPSHTARRFHQGIRQ